MRNNLIIYKNGFVELKFPYSEKIIQFIKSNFVAKKFNPTEKAWLIPVILESDRKALEELKENFGFRAWYETEPQLSSAWRVDEKRHDLILKFIHPKSDAFSKIIYFDNFEDLKRYKTLSEEIKKKAYWRQNTKELVFGISETILEFLKLRKIDTLFIENVLKPYLEKLNFLYYLGNIDEPFKKIEHPILYPFQVAGVQASLYRLKKYGATLLADEMGLGKTIQAGFVIRSLKAYPTLVVTPASLKYSFADKLTNIVKINDVKVLNGTKPYTIPQGKVVVINYDILDAWRGKLEDFPFKLVVADEAHYLKNPNAKRTRAFKQIAQNIPYKLLMTGTPFSQNLVELYDMLSVAGLNDFLAPNKQEFVDRFVVFEERNIKSKGITVKIPVGVKNAEELNTKLYATVMIRRTKEQVLKDLPSKIVSKEVVDITNRREYEAYFNDKDKFDVDLMLEKLEDKGIKVPSTVWEGDLIEKLEFILEERPSIFMELHGELYRIVGEGKIKAVKEFVEDYFENNPKGKLVIFAYHKSVQEKLFKELKKYKPLWLKGESSAKEKASIEKEFNTNSENRVLVASLMAGKEGLTFTSADTEIFAELWFNPQDLSQAEDRIHRIGQTQTAKIYYFVAKDTIDEQIWEVVKQRSYTFKRVMEKKLETSPKTKLKV